MKTSILAIGHGAGLALILAASGVAYGDGNVVGAIGVRSLTGDLWSDLDNDNQLAIGVSADFGLGEIPLYISTGLQVSVGDGGEGDSTASVADLSVGLKLMPTEGAMRPYVGAGVASVGASIDTDFFGDDDDQSFGFYVGGGALFRIGSHFTMGVDLRYVGGTDIELFGVEGDADSVTATALFGYSWGD